MPRKKPTDTPAQETRKAWAITQQDIDVTTDLEAAFATTRCLPPEEEIPDAFWGRYRNVEGNVYHRMADALFCGDNLPEGDVDFNEGFRPDGPAMFKFLMAHLRSFEPSHQHKIAAIAFMISKIVTVTPTKGK